MPAPDTPVTDNCRVYVMDISYFSGKFEAYLRYKGINYQRIEAHHAVLYGDVYKRTGTMKVPAVELSDGRWLKDTSPMIRWFEQQHPASPVIPEDPPLAFVASLIEDYADEWLWRPAMWWRWIPSASRSHLGYRIATEVLGSFPGPNWLKARYFAWRQSREWLWDDGMSKRNSAQIRDMYPMQLSALELILRDQAYLLGEQPSIADFGYFASMFRHFGNDPDPAKLMRQTAPAVYEWLARLWNAPCDGAQHYSWIWPRGEGWNMILADICARYLPYLHQNALAFQQQHSRFDFQAGGLELLGTKVSDYRVWCRQELQRQYQQLSAQQKAIVAEFLNPHGGIDSLSADGMIDSGLDAEFELPFEAKPLAPASHRIKTWLFGNPRQARA